ncbi:vitellogenin II precursor [Algibacter lectus]|uniref:Vitellogenin II n=2 Tax=Algibacter lectus TaxID=221126 RepID=A0A090WQM9_9FLAO|nr:vitellogenin II precursor [Algibacter lectus]
MPNLALLALLIGVSSCGSYQYVGVDNDGIYGEETVRVVQNEETEVATPSSSNSKYYENYFKTGALETEQMIVNSEIFTDIDSYESDNYTDEEAIVTDNTYQGYAGWGTSHQQRYY